MLVEEVALVSDGARLAATLMLPDETAAAPGLASSRDPAGWGFATRSSISRITRRCTAAGFAVLTLDYRGFGDSEGDATLPRPAWPRSPTSGPALTYLETRPEIDPGRLGRLRLRRHGRRQRGRAPPGLDRARQGDREPGPDRGRPRLAAPDAPRARVAGVPRPRPGRPRSLRRRPGEASCVAPRDGIMVPTPERRTTTSQERRGRPGARARSRSARRRRSWPTGRSTSWTASRRAR